MIVDTMSKQEVMDYIRKEYNATILPYFRNHLKLYQSKIYPICERGKQRKVTLPWATITSKDRTMFHFQVFGDKEGIDSLSISEFDWQGQHCFVYIKHNLMVVFSEHAIHRYEERVLERDKKININVKHTFNGLLKYIPLSYRTVLPSRTHPLCYYYVILNALFLADFDDDRYIPYQSEGSIWLNTCISLKEAGTSQTKILETLSLMPFYIKNIGFNPFESKETFKKTISLKSDSNKWAYLQCFCKSVYLIDKLFVMMDLPVSKETIDCFYTEMRYAGGLLQVNGTDISKLAPYGKDGIAIRGELDYKEKTL